MYSTLSGRVFLTAHRSLFLHLAVYDLCHLLSFSSHAAAAFDSTMARDDKSNLFQFSVVFKLVAVTTRGLQNR